MGLIVCFIDGLGLTPQPTPPWSTALIPTLRTLLGVVPSAELAIARPGLWFGALDATLGVDGIPQSGTGHTTLWTGVNAAALLGRHYPAYPAPSQHELIAEHSLFRQVRALGRSAWLATLQREPYWELVASRQQRATAATLAARAAELPLATLADFHAGRAVPWDISGAYLQRWGALPGVKPLEGVEAGARLAALADSYDLVHFECYLPDFVGHQRIDAAPDEVLALVDDFLAGILAHMAPTSSLLVVSDHGNLEEPEHRRHTRNPVPGLVVGPLADAAPGLVSIADITPWIVAQLGAPA